MANYIVYIASTAGKGSTVDFRYPNTTTNTGTGHTSSNRLELEAGDTVEFRGIPGTFGGGTISGFSSTFWTDTSNLSYSQAVSPLSFGTKTVSSGTSGTDDITATAGQGGATDNFYFEKVAPAITAPVINNVTNDNASAENVTATVNLTSNGSGGTLEYAQTTTNSVPSTGWQSSASFTHPRGTTRYYWASQDQDTSGTYDDSGAVAVGYIAPDVAVTPGNELMGYGSSSVDITITGVTSGEEYQLRNQTGTSSYQSGTASGTSITISQTSGLPSTGTTSTYQVFARRPLSLGGDNNYDATGDTYTIERAPTPSDAPTSRDHCKSEFVYMSNVANTVNYMAPNPNTVIKRRTPSGTVSTLVSDTGSAPSESTIASSNISQGSVYYGEKSNGDPEAVFFFGSANQQANFTPKSLKGQKFVSYSNRNAPATHYMWSETAQTIYVYDNISGGIKTGNPTSKVTLTANTVSSYTSSTLNAYIFFTGSADFVMTKSSNGTDKQILSPFADTVYSGSRQSSFPGIAEDGATPSSASSTWVVTDTTDQVMRIAIADGAGSDSESALGDHNLSDVYVWGAVLSDFVIVAPFTGTILIERWGGSYSGWVVEETFNPTGSATSPTAYIRRAQEGFGVAGASRSGSLGSPRYFSSDATLWRWRGTDNFFVRLNFGSDEEMLLGYSKDFDDVFNITGPKTLASYESSVTYSVTNGNANTTDYALWSGTPPTSKGLTLTGDLGSSGELSSALDGGTVEYTKRWSRAGDNNWADPLHSSNDGKKLIVGKLGYIRFSNDSQTPGSGKFLARDQQIAGIGTTYNEDGTVLSDSETVVSTYGEGVAVRTTGGQTLSSSSYASSATIKNDEYLYLRTNQASEPGEKARASAVVADVHLYTMTLSLNRTLDSSNDYGITIFDTDGTTVVLGPDTRYIKVLAIETINIAAGSNQLIECDTTDIDRYNSDVIITNGGSVSSSIAGSEKPFTLSLGASGYTITANSNNTANLTGNAIVIGF